MVHKLHLVWPFSLNFIYAEPAGDDEAADVMEPLPPKLTPAAPTGKSLSANFDNMLRVDQPKRAVTKSLLLDFDPLLFNRAQEQKPIEEGPEEAVGGAVYGVVNKKPKAVVEEHIYDAVAVDEDASEDEYDEPPPPPPRQVLGLFF